MCCEQALSRRVGEVRYREHPSKKTDSRRLCFAAAAAVYPRHRKRCVDRRENRSTFGRPRIRSRCEICAAARRRDVLGLRIRHFVAHRSQSALYRLTNLRARHTSFLTLNSWLTFSPYLYNRVWSELTCCNSLSHSRLACSRSSAHIQPSVNNPRRQSRPIHGHELS